MWLLGCVAAFVCALSQAADDPAVTRVRSFYGVLLETMKHAKQLGLSGRYDKLAPAIRETFDLPAMTRIAVGPVWTSIPADQQTALVEAFSRMTIATYASRFDGYSGERLEVLGEQKIKRGTMVQSRIVKSDGEPVQINYMVHDNQVGYQVRDVYVTGTISELATKRSEFATILRTNGIDGLIASLNKKADDLRG